MDTEISIMPTDQDEIDRIDDHSEHRTTELRHNKKMEPLKKDRDEPGTTVGEPFVEYPRMTCRNVDVFYGDKQAILNVSVDIAGNEVISMIGPSGCGKSSLVRAGLLPLLAQHVTPVYIEATANETETRLLDGLRKRCPGLPGNLNLTETIAALRRGQGVPDGDKLLIVLDQFEQWLHAKKEEDNTELVQALRQCMGASAVRCDGEGRLLDGGHTFP